MKTRVLFSLILILVSSEFYGQTKPPGYLGKRLVLKAGATTFFPVVGDIRKYQEEKIEEFASRPGFRPTFEIEYVISRKASITFLGDFIRMGSPLVYRAPGVSYEKLNGRMRGLAGGIGVKNYRMSAGALAPNGGYFGYGLKYSRCRYFGQDAPTSEEPLSHLYSFGDFYLWLGLGRNFMIADGFGLDLGLDINLPVTGLVHWHDNDYARYYQVERVIYDNGNPNYNLMSYMVFGIRGCLFFML